MLALHVDLGNGLVEHVFLLVHAIAQLLFLLLQPKDLVFKLGYPLVFFPYSLQFAG